MIFVWLFISIQGYIFVQIVIVEAFIHYFVHIVVGRWIRKSFMLIDLICIMNFNCIWKFSSFNPKVNVDSLISQSSSILPFPFYVSFIIFFTFDVEYGNSCFDYILCSFEYMEQFELFLLWSSYENVNPLKLVTWIFNHIFFTCAFTVIILDTEYGNICFVCCVTNSLKFFLFWKLWSDYFDVPWIKFSIAWITLFFYPCTCSSNIFFNMLFSKIVLTLLKCVCICLNLPNYAELYEVDNYKWLSEKEYL